MASLPVWGCSYQDRREGWQGGAAGRPLHTPPALSELLRTGAGRGASAFSPVSVPLDIPGHLLGVTSVPPRRPGSWAP